MGKHSEGYFKRYRETQKRLGICQRCGQESRPHRILCQKCSDVVVTLGQISFQARVKKL